MSTKSPGTRNSSCARMAPHILPMAVCCALVMSLAAADAMLGPGLVSWLINSAALAVVCVTAMAKAGDMDCKVTTPKSQLRRISLVLVAATSIGLIAGPLLPGELYPSWTMVGFNVGVAAMCITSGSISSWCEYVSGLPIWREK